jgi:hypothetical protein
MFANTLTLPHAGGNITLTRIDDSAPYTSVYSFKDSVSEVRLTFRHTKTKGTATEPAKERHNVEIVRTIFATPTVEEYSRKAYIVMEQLPNDLDFYDFTAMFYLLAADTNALLAGLVNNES